MSIQDAAPKYPLLGAEFMARMAELDALQRRLEHPLRARLRRLRRAHLGKQVEGMSVGDPRMLDTATRFKGAKTAQLKQPTQDVIGQLAAAESMDRDAWLEREKHKRWVLQDEERWLERRLGVQWTISLVERRTREAFEVLLRTPAERGPRAFGSAMPDCVAEFEDVVGRPPEALTKREAVLRLGPPSMEESERMWQVLAAMRSLPAHLHVALTWCMRCEVYGVRWQVAKHLTGLDFVQLGDAREAALEGLLARFRKGVDDEQARRANESLP